jgi:hypothetical protein
VAVTRIACYARTPTCLPTVAHLSSAAKYNQNDLDPRLLALQYQQELVPRGFHSTAQDLPVWRPDTVSLLAVTFWTASQNGARQEHPMGIITGAYTKYATGAVPFTLNSPADVKQRYPRQVTGPQKIPRDTPPNWPDLDPPKVQRMDEALRHGDTT